jgi:hypothetical protein
LPFVTACPLDELDPDKNGTGGSGGYNTGIPGFGGWDAGSLPFDAGSGGAGGSGANTGGASGSGGAPAAGACRVKCMDDLLATCTGAMGSCVAEVNLDSGMSNLCFSNGVKYYSTSTNTGSVARFVNPDGSVCYIQDTPIPTGDFGHVTAYWKDGSGKLVATQMVDVNKMTTSYLCADGTAYQLGPECWGKVGGAASTPSSGCAQGTCR